MSLYAFLLSNNQGKSNLAMVNINVVPLSNSWFPLPRKSVYAKRLIELQKIEKPVDIAVDHNDNIYILSAPDRGKSEVIVCNMDLQIQHRFAIEARNPRGLTVSNNSVYIADTGGNRILKYLTNGKLDTSFGNNSSIGRSGSGEGEFDNPWAVGVDWKENIYVSDSGNNRMQIFDASGKFKSQWQQRTVYDIKSWQRKYIIRNEYDEKSYVEMLSSLRRINGFDQVRKDDRKPLKKPTGFYLRPSGIGGEVFLADTDNHKIKRLFSESGGLSSASGKEGTELGYFHNPMDISFDLEMEQLAVADSGNNRIQIFQLYPQREFSFFPTSAMTCIQEISDQNLSAPLGVAVVTKQPDQFIYIADTGNNRVIKMQNGFNKPGTSPVDVWNQFKDALLADDINKALSFIAPWRKGDYTKILESMRPHLKEFVGKMGDMTLSSQDIGSASYELSTVDPNGKHLLFPVHFTLDEDGTWKIDNF